MAADETGRIEAFSDGVFAIAITLLVLDVKVPRAIEAGHALGTALAAMWPTYLAFVTSFATILIMWINHHRVFTLIGRADDRLMFYNGLVLLGVTFVPFPTALVAEYLRHDGQNTAAAVYNGTFIFIAICYNLLWRTAAVDDRLLHAGASRQAIRSIFNAYRFGPVWYAVAFALAFVSVTASLLVNLGLAIFFSRPTIARQAVEPDGSETTEAHGRSTTGRVPRHVSGIDTLAQH